VSSGGHGQFGPIFRALVVRDLQGLARQQQQEDCEGEERELDDDRHENCKRLRAAKTKLDERTTIWRRRVQYLDGKLFVFKGEGFEGESIMRFFRTQSGEVGDL